MAEDYCAALAEDAKGDVHVGHRAAASDVIAPKGTRIVSKGVDEYVTGTVFPTAGESVSGTYGNGIITEGKPANSAAKPHAPPADVKLADLPAVASAPTGRQVQDVYKRLIDAKTASTETLASKMGLYLGADWDTLGEWSFTYGDQTSILWGHEGPFDAVVSSNDAIKVDSNIGPHHSADDDVRRWCPLQKTDNIQALYNPERGYRTLADLDDHGEAYPRSFEGPDLHMTVTVPKGAFQVSLYFLNKDGHAVLTSQRDYLVELRRVKASPSGKAPETTSPVLAKCRVENFWSGVYQKFAVSGPGTYDFTVRRQYSLNATCAGLFIDQLPRKWDSELDDTYANIDPARITPRLTVAVHLFDYLDGAFVTPGQCYLQQRGRILALRAAEDCPGRTGDLILGMEQRCSQWTLGGRRFLESGMAREWEKYRERNKLP